MKVIPLHTVTHPNKVGAIQVATLTRTLIQVATLTRTRIQVEKYRELYLNYKEFCVLNVKDMVTRMEVSRCQSDANGGQSVSQHTVIENTTAER